jgi:methylmalonyl-CoA mutase cobalamin-binding domain/chain
MENKSGTGEALKNLKEAILEYDVDAAKKAAQAIVDKGIDPMLAIKEAFGGTANILHERFDRGECYLPHLVLAGDAMTAAGEILEATVPKDSIEAKKVVVIGTVEADLHSVGKNIVAMMMRSSGFEVHDMGVDVKSSAFINRAKETNADIIALSSLLTTTRPYQREVIEELDSLGLRKQFKVIVGGGPITPEWAKEIGADGYGSDAMEGLEVAKKLCGLTT